MTESAAVPILPPDKMQWPCPTCGKKLRDHADRPGYYELGNCYLIAIMKSVLGDGIGWRVIGQVDDEPLVIGEMR